MKKKYWAHTEEYLSIGSDITCLVGEVMIEKPNADLYSFLGKINIGGNIHPLTLKNFIPKGAKLRNTQWIYGLVVYTGKETKIRLNSI